MSLAYDITDQCLEILLKSQLPSPNRELIHIHLTQIKRVLESDEFLNHKCDFFAKGRLEEVLQQLRDACSDPSDVKAISNLVSCTAGILTLLGANTRGS